MHAAASRSAVSTLLSSCLCVVCFVLLSCRVRPDTWFLISPSIYSAAVCASVFFHSGSLAALFTDWFTA